MRPAVHLVGNRIELLLTVARQVRALGQALANQTVGIFVGAAAASASALRTGILLVFCFRKDKYRHRLLQFRALAQARMMGSRSYPLSSFIAIDMLLRMSRIGPDFYSSPLSWPK